MKNKVFVSLKSATLFVMLFAGVATASAQESTQPKRVADTTFVSAMRNPDNWKVYKVEPAKKIQFGPKPKEPPIYKKAEDGWMEIPADSIHQPIPAPVVNKAKEFSRGK